MQTPTLYLFVGYPGSGKTTTAKIITDLTGATHLWADHERKAMFGTPSHSKAESNQLYSRLNTVTEQLLSDGKSVVYDTNFNYRHDRDRLRQIAAQHHSSVRLIWLVTPKNIAYKRAALESDDNPTRLFGNMKHEVFERMAGQLQTPDADEQSLQLDGTKITPEYVKQQLGL